MLAPIQKPTGRFAAGTELELEGIPMYSGFSPIEEPCLLSNDIAWNGRGQQLLSFAAPEMGAALDAKELGGRITIFVLCYGDYYDMHVKCLDSILRTVPLDRLDLRIAANCVGQSSLNYIRTLPVTRTYLYRENKYKYPIMREMFYDPDLPIVTNYLAWFDDSCHVQHNNWLNLFAADVLNQPSSVAMYGIKLYYTFDFTKEDPRPWLERQPWHKGKQLRTHRGTPAPNGDRSHFCADWFFTLRTDVLKKCILPPEGVLQKGGDMLMGEVLYQHGYNIKTFNAAKSLVYQPLYRDLPRRADKLHTYPWQA